MLTGEAMLDLKGDPRTPKWAGPGASDKFPQLLLLCSLALIFVAPGLSAFNWFVTFRRWQYYVDPDLWTYSAITTAFELILAICSIVAGVALLRRRQGAITVVRAFLWVYLIYFALAVSLVLQVRPHLAEWAIRPFVQALIFSGVWLTYLALSRRVRKAFDLPDRSEKRAIRAELRNTRTLHEVFDRQRFGINQYLIGALFLSGVFGHFFSNPIAAALLSPGWARFLPWGVMAIWVVEIAVLSLARAVILQLWRSDTAIVVSYTLLIGFLSILTNIFHGALGFPYPPFSFAISNTLLPFVFTLVFAGSIVLGVRAVGFRFSIVLAAMIPSLIISYGVQIITPEQSAYFETWKVAALLTDRLVSAFLFYGAVVLHRQSRYSGGAHKLAAPASG